MNPRAILLTTILLSLFIFGCQSSYKPEGLRKLSDEEIYKRTRAKEAVMNHLDITVKNEKGEIISSDSIKKIGNPKDYTVDVYVDEKGERKELILRLANEEDFKRAKKIQEIYNAPPEFDLIEDFDCEKTKEVLAEVYEKDQSTRGKGNTYDPQSDHDNQRIVISIIEKCGFPTVESHGEISVNAVFFVLQHADNSIMLKYFPMIKASSVKGDLKQSSVAMMEDRLLMWEGKKQKYGTQVTKNIDTGDFVLYNLRDPEYVDKRRREVGLGPLNEYLGRRNIVFDVEQKE